MRIGIDLGGSKIEVIALSAAGEVLERRRRPSPHGDYRATLRAIAELVQETEAKLGRRGSVGVGIPGAISPATRLVKNANSTWLIGKPLEADLGVALGRPVRLANDANCFAVSEAVDGAGVGARVVFGVILGTGVGGGIAIDGRPLTGRGAIAGEWGHNPLPWPTDAERPGPLCYCGRRGCIETFVSGPGLLRDYRVHGGDADDAETVAERASTGEPLARAALERYQNRLARGLTTVVNLLDPDVIVIGGGLSNLAGLAEGLTDRIAAQVFSDHWDTPIVPARFGDSSGVRGAAWLWGPDEAPEQPQPADAAPSQSLTPEQP
ncbi:MAG: ROK family protein [Kiloniellales bacterium]